MCLRKKIGPDPRNFNQRVSLGRNDLLIRTFPRKRKEYIVDSSDLRKYQILGFEDYNHYVGYLATNGLNNLVPEFQILDNADHYGDF